MIRQRFERDATTLDDGMDGLRGGRLSTVALRWLPLALRWPAFEKHSSIDQRRQ
jgi:hypothetical protein